MKRLLLSIILILALLAFAGCEEESEENEETAETEETAESTEDGEETAAAGEAEYEFTITEVEPMYALVQQQQGPYEQYPEILEELIPVIEEAGIELTGAPFGIYYDDPAQTKPEELRWVVGFPVAEDVAAPEGLEAKEYDGGQVALTTVYGEPNWEETTVYDELYTFIAEQGLIPAGPMVEVYRWETEKPEDYETDIFVFVSKPYPVGIEEEPPAEGDQ